MPKKSFRAAVAVGGEAPGGGGGGGEDDVDVLLPLSKVFLRDRSSERSSSREISKKNGPTKAAASGSVASDVLLEGFAVPRVSNSLKGSFEAGDLVWAKAFPYTWWPGCVRVRRGSAVLVSFFGTDLSRYFRESEICPFEENYPRMSRMVGLKLEDEVDLALAEVSRRTALGLRCDCRGPIEGLEIGQIAKVRKEFEPADVLGFVLDKAVYAWVDTAEMVCTARVAAQVNAYRRHVLVAGLVEVKDGFGAADMLGFVRRAAISVWVVDEDAADAAHAAALVNVHRCFTSVNPGLVYQRMTEEEDGSDSSASEDIHSEMTSDSPSKDEIVDVDSYENELEERSTFCQEVQSNGDICMLNRDTILASDEEFTSLVDNQIKDIGELAGSARVDFRKKRELKVKRLKLCELKVKRLKLCELKVKKSIASDASPVFNDAVTWKLKVSNGPIASDLEQLSSQSRATAKIYEDEKIDVINNVIGKDKLPLPVDICKAGVPPDLSDKITGKSKTICRSISLEEGFLGREADQHVISDISCKLYKNGDLTTVNESHSCSLKRRNESSSRLSWKPNLKPVAQIFHGEKGDVQSLRGMLQHLYYLALDPFHLESQNLTHLHQRFINYRALAFQNIHDSLFTSNVHENNQKAEALEVVGPDQMICIHNNTAEIQLYDKFGDRCDTSSEAHLLSPSCDDTEIKTRNIVSIKAPHMPLITDGGVKLQSSAKVSFASKITIDKRKSADSDSIQFDFRSTFPVTRDCEGVNKKRFDPIVGRHSSFSLHKVRSFCSGAKLGTNSLTVDNLNSTGKDDFCAKPSVASEAGGKEFSMVNIGCGVMECQPGGDACASSSITHNISNIMEATCSSAPPTCASRDGLHRKRRLGPVHPYFSKWPKSWPSKIPAKLYASPLVMDTPNPPVRLRHSRVEDGISGLPRSLHVKFPKDFDLPSKEEIEKLFRVFGPLDHSRTRVFFYTGAAKVVFVNPADTESAYNYVKNQKTFNQAGMRFWLDAHEKFRRDSDGDQALLVSTGECSSLNLKSCLKKPRIHGNDVPKAKHTVRFATHQSVKVIAD